MAGSGATACSLLGILLRGGARGINNKFLSLCMGGRRRLDSFFSFTNRRRTHAHTHTPRQRAAVPWASMKWRFSWN